MRKQPGSPPALNPKQQIEGVITQVREYELITPLFGGGVNPREADPVTVIRATEIRGHLRFWWRACRGGLFKDSVVAMKKAEDTLWGAAYKKGDPPIAQERTIQIIIETIKRGNPEKPFTIEQNRAGRNQPKPHPDIPAYAAFPLQPDQSELRKPRPDVQDVLSRISFRLTISFPADKQEDVEAALWAWETFGGIGARTRRGFGALRCTRIEENGQSVSVNLPLAQQEQVRQWIQSNLKRYVVDGLWPNNIPHLARQGISFKLISSGNSDNALIIWKVLVTKLRDFRQMRRSSTKQDARHPGRSVWPEPSAIRQLTNQTLEAHSTPIPNPPIRKFPRAVFGLPIIFQFKDNNKRNSDDPLSDPRKTVLQLETSERFASPLILKPLACREGKFVGLALILAGTRLEEEQLVLKTQEGNQEQWEVAASFGIGEVLALANQNQRTLIQIDDQTDALQAFLNYL